MGGVMKTAAEIETWLTEQIAGTLGVPEEEIGLTETFDSFGLASRDAVSLSGDLEDYLNRRLSPTLLYQYPTIRELAAYLTEGDAPARASPGVQAAERRTPVTEEAVSGMSEEEAEAALLRKLLELDE
jgi:acyl carrier protein